MQGENMRYSLRMINRNGYTIAKTFSSIKKCIQFAKWYPLEVFFAWIYDSKTNAMLYQNEYGRTFRKCNNETFIPYY